jgi:GNAT superfamily N-acetyltransferase
MAEIMRFWECEAEVIRIESIADYPHLVETIARWHWEEWGHADPAGSLESWTEGLMERTNRDMIPTSYVALDRDELLGSVTLVDRDMSTRPDLSPWLAGVYVKPERRGQGVGSALVRHAVAKVGEMGIGRLYLYTSPAREFYDKLGWRHVANDYYEGQPVSILAFDIATQANLNNTPDSEGVQI